MEWSNGTLFLVLLTTCDEIMNNQPSEKKSIMLPPPSCFLPPCVNRALEMSWEILQGQKITCKVFARLLHEMPWLARFLKIKHFRKIFPKSLQLTYCLSTGEQVNKFFLAKIASEAITILFFLPLGLRFSNFLKEPLEVTVMGHFQLWTI